MIFIGNAKLQGGHVGEGVWVFRGLQFPLRSFFISRIACTRTTGSKGVWENTNGRAETYLSLACIYILIPSATKGLVFYPE